MLNHISISNYAIVDQLNLDVHSGMTALTGETGAGKSIVLDALSLVLGGRSDSDCVRHGTTRADIRASFDLQRIPAAMQWLQQHDYSTEGEDCECILRRIITKEGRSRGYINGVPVTLAELKSLGSMLVDIHAQHAHQSLLKKSNHSQLLDEFANSLDLAQEVARIAQQYQRIQAELHTLVTQQQEQDERTQLLQYQLEELEQLNLQLDEVPQLEQEHHQQAQAETMLTACDYIVQICSHDDHHSVLQQLSSCLQKLSALSVDHPAINNSLEMLTSAQIQIEEVVSELGNFMDNFEADPQRMQFIEARLSSIFDLARKHRVQPEELLDKQQQIFEELAKLQDSEGHIQTFEQQLATLRQQHHSAAEQLSAQRKLAALKLEKQVTQRIALLGMPNGRFFVNFSEIAPRAISSHGHESLEFLVTTNPGQEPKPLAKVASGGELSRISLAIQVIIAQVAATPTLIFDEVDVGIGGGTAEIVGNMLREVGKTGQVLCVTHQPQVASQAHQHLYISKAVKQNQSFTSIQPLEGETRVTEIARMLGGLELTQPTLHHAREMLQMAQSA